jgi:hypothetical protein
MIETTKAGSEMLQSPEAASSPQATRLLLFVVE